MAKIQYIKKKLGDDKLVVIEQANEIIESYQEQGYELTLRQLYYQFVARGLLDNKQTNYDRLGDIVSDGRLLGLIDWDAIIDRTRNLMGRNHSTSPGQHVARHARSFCLDLWEGQEYRPEVWIEKDALVGVIENVCSRNDVDYFSCRGYTSMSEMHAAAKRLEAYADAGQTPVIIHLGDHDPSGIDMTRDINDRIELFMGGLHVNRIALSLKQVRQFNPPPNPAKLTDSRCKPYIEKYGSSSWELDALEPSYLDKLVEAQIAEYRNTKLWNARVAAEKAGRKTIEKTAERMDK